MASPTSWRVVTLVVFTLMSLSGNVGSTCTVADNCSQGHATAVFLNTSVSPPSCDCNCTQQWVGPSCALCPSQFDSSTCSTCAVGRNQSTFPVCTVVDRPCNVSLDCNANFTLSVSGTTASGCVCRCKGQAVAPTCTCPQKYVQNPLGSCAQCAYGYDQSTYPSCYKLCNLTSDCPDRAIAVSGNVFTGCQCTCFGGWSGANCSVCSPNWDASSGCVTCTQGFAKINNTCVACGDDRCSFHGTPRFNATACYCECRNHWSGDDCMQCPFEYDMYNDCSTCNAEEGYHNISGLCMPSCTSYDNCSNHAANPVLINKTGGGCLCSCRNKWNGSVCDVCPSPYDSAKDCGDCLPGLFNYPICNNQTTTTMAPNASTTTTMAPNASTTTTMAPNASTTTMAPNASTTTTMAPNASTTTMAPNASTTTTMAPNASTTTMAPNATTVAPTTHPPTSNRTNNTSTYSLTSISESPCSSASLSQHMSTTELMLTATATVTSMSDTPSATSTRSAISPSTSPTHHGITTSRNGTFTPSGSLATLSPSHSNSSLVTMSNRSRSLSLTLSLCAQSITDCTNATNHSVATEPPEHCFCRCVNQWSEMFCNYCHPRYNTSDDCGSCFVTAEKYFVLYPRCDYISFVSGFVNIPLSAETLMHTLVRREYFEAIAADLTRFLSSVSAVDGAGCGAYARNVTVYVIAWNGGNNFTIDVDVLDQNIDNVTRAADCVVNSLLGINNATMLEDSSSKNYFLKTASSLAMDVATGSSSLFVTANVSDYFYMANFSFVKNYSYPSQISPCPDAYWCYTIPPIVDPVALAPNFTWLIIAGSLVAAVAITLGGVFFLWYRPVQEFKRVFRVRDESDVDYRRVRDVDGLEAEWCNKEEELELQSASKMFR